MAKQASCLKTTSHSSDVLIMSSLRHRFDLDFIGLQCRVLLCAADERYIYHVTMNVLSLTTVSEYEQCVYCI